MPTIKTAISIDEDLFKKVKKLSQKLDIPKSRIFSQAVEYFIKKNDNLELLQKINKFYSSVVKEVDSEYLTSVKKIYSKTVDKW